jgi:hypothetical protein
MSINELAAIVPPPDRPLEVGDPKQWAEIEQKLGLVFPTDYLEFTLHYGSGYFYEGCVSVHNPFSSMYLNKLNNCARLCS